MWSCLSINVIYICDVRMCLWCLLDVVAAISWLVLGCSPWWLPNLCWFQDAAGKRAVYCRGGLCICNGCKLNLVTNTDQWVTSFIRKARYKNAHNVTGSAKARYQSWPVGPRTWLIHRDIRDTCWKQASPLIERKRMRIETDVSHFIETEETQVHRTHLWC
jgi:hypothetical protein